MFTISVLIAVFAMFWESRGEDDFLIGLLCYGLPAGLAGITLILIAAYCDLKCLFTRRDVEEEFDKLNGRLFGPI